MAKKAPGTPATTAAATAGTPPVANDWRQTLIDEFDSCVDEINAKLANTPLTDPSWARLDDQRQQYWNAVSALQGSLFDTVLRKVPTLTTALTAAADQAQKAAKSITAIGDAVSLAASLLALAAAIAGAVATGNPGGLSSAAQSVVAAGGKILKDEG